MPRTTDRPSIRDVASLAGVSHQTVSRVLNEPERVSATTKAAVQGAIEKLGYRPSKAARSLALSDSMTIGAIIVHSTLFGPSQMHFAIDAGARQRGYAAATVTIDDDSPESLASARDHLLSLGVEGVVVIAWSRPVLELAKAFAARLPTVVVTEGDVPPTMTRVSSDNYGGARAAVRALIAAGHTRIGHLAGPEGWLESDVRRAGWRDAAGDLAGPVVEAGWWPDGGYRKVDELLDEGVDAIFAANDMVALGAIKRMSERGLSVPDDVAVVGYDDTEVAAFLTVPLASVRQPFSEVGSVAVEMLFELMRGAEPTVRELHPTYQHRESAGAPVDPAVAG